MKSEVIGVISQSPNKVSSFAPPFANLGYKTKWVPPSREIDEVEDIDPRAVLPDKMHKYVMALNTYLEFLTEIGEGIDWALIVDVLGLNMPTGPGKLGSADGVLKKPTGLSAIHAAAVHFGKMACQTGVDGYVWNAFVPAARVARVDRRGNVDEPSGRCLWDNPLYFGYSFGLLEILSDPDKLKELVDHDVLPSAMFTTSSINGIKNELLIPAFVDLARMHPDDGVRLRIKYGSMDAVLDSPDDQLFDGLLGIVGQSLSNVTPNLVRQIDEEIKHKKLI